MHSSSDLCDGSDPKDPRFGRTTLIPKYIPRRFRGFEVTDQRSIDWIANPVDTLYITGPVGTGKTCTAYGLVERFFRLPAPQRRCVAYFAGGQVADFLDSISPGHLKDEDKGSAERDPLLRAMRANLTLLDDLGASKISEWREEQIFRVMDARYRDELPTIVTSNIAPAHLSDVVGERIASRISQDCIVVSLTGKDKRKG
jgi:DNA replication protein DnaC